MAKKATKAVKRRKTAAQRKDLIIPVRVTREQKEKLAAKAERRGLGLSSWRFTLVAPENPASGE